MALPKIRRAFSFSPHENRNFSEKEKKRNPEYSFILDGWTIWPKKIENLDFLLLFFFHFFPQNFSENSLYSKINPWQKSRINGKYLPLFLCCVVIWNSFAFYPYLRAFLAFFCHLQIFICLRYFYKKKFNLPQISSLATALKLY